MSPKRRRIVAGSNNWLHRVRLRLIHTGEVVVWYDKRIPRKLVRKQLYSEFPQLQIEELTRQRTSGEFLILARGVRTNRAHYVDPNVRESYPESIELQPVSGFDPGSADPAEEYNMVRKGLEKALLCTCACCGKKLPLSAYTLRLVNGYKVPQAYCRACMKAYKHWRYEFLKEHKAKSLKTAYSDGHSYNEEFRRWWHSNGLDNFEVNCKYFEN